MVIIGLNKKNDRYLFDLEEFKKKENTKIMILDFYEDRGSFSKCMKLGIDGYILANIDLEDM